jgi:hypothetical protein
MKNLRTKIISCQTVGEELKSLLPSDFDWEKDCVVVPPGDEVRYYDMFYGCRGEV